MGKTKTIFAAVCVTALFSAETNVGAGQGLTASEWIAQCNDQLLTYRALCHQYALGVADGLRMWHDLRRSTALICIPDRTTAEQLVSVGQRYFQDNPRHREQPAGAFLTLAFQDTWSCED